MNDTEGNPAGNTPPTPPPDYSIERDLGLAVKICHGCHTSNLPTSQYCYKCGLKLPDEATIPGDMTQVIPAGFWQRFVAFVLDNIFITVITLMIFVFVFAIVFSISPEMAERYMLSDYSWESILETYEVSLTWLDVVAYLAIIVIEIGYWTVAVGWKGRTVGKMMLGMKVVRTDGSRVSYLRAFGRYWGYALCFMTFGIGFLVIALEKQKRGLHDFICDTMVIKV